MIQRVLFLIRVWANNLPDEPKIKEVFNMLKKQGTAVFQPCLSMQFDSLSGMRFPEELPDTVGNNMPIGHGVRSCCPVDLHLALPAPVSFSHASLGCLVPWRVRNGIGARVAVGARRAPVQGTESLSSLKTGGFS